MNPRALAPWAIPAVAIAIIGCGGSDMPERVTASGAVSFDGTPVEKGQIVFLPADGKGRTDAAEIADGNYSLEVTPGKKRVEITATREAGVAADGLPNYEDFVPKSYNTDSKLTAEVTADGENDFDFPLKADGSVP